MEKKNNDRAQELLICITSLPQNIIKLHGLANMPEFLLHNICQKHCFNLAKAAYFVDNPDFDSLKGVAGFHHPESYEKDHWSDPDTFTKHMQNAPFNKRVRDILLTSIRKNNHDQDKIVADLSNALEFNNPNYLSWPVKYNNHGLLLFEPRDEEHELIQEHLHSGVHLLGFCPVF